MAALSRFWWIPWLCLILLALAMWCVSAMLPALAVILAVTAFVLLLIFAVLTGIDVSTGSGYDDGDLSSENRRKRR